MRHPSEGRSTARRGRVPLRVGAKNLSPFFPHGRSRFSPTRCEAGIQPHVLVGATGRSSFVRSRAGIDNFRSLSGRFLRSGGGAKNFSPLRRRVGLREEGYQPRWP